MTDAPALVNLSPLVWLMLTGVAVAVLPLLWVWRSQPHATPAQRLGLLTLVTVFLTFDLIVFGAFTRLTDSGLGCPDWPGCYGSATPVGASAEIAAAQAAMPSGPVTFPKAWIEMIHRYLATGVGVLILVLTVASWRNRRSVPVSPVWPWLTLVWVCVQGAFGALTVTMKLFPAIVTLHLLFGLGLLALLRAQALQYARAAGQAPWLPVSRPQAWGLWAVFACLWLQIALGGWVSTNYAVLACTDFPTCQGRWWPDMDFASGFALWRELGQQHSGAALPFAALTAIHMVHRLFAFVVLLALAWAARVLMRSGHAVLQRQGRWLGALALLQLLTGLSNVVLQWPLVAAVLHTAGAAALILVLTGTCLTVRPSGTVVSAVARTPVTLKA